MTQLIHHERNTSSWDVCQMPNRREELEVSSFDRELYRRVTVPRGAISLRHSSSFGCMYNSKLPIIRETYTADSKCLCNATTPIPQSSTDPCLRLHKGIGALLIGRAFNLIGIIFLGRLKKQAVCRYRNPTSSSSEHEKAERHVSLDNDTKINVSWPRFMVRTWNES